MKAKDITPKKARCGVAACPSAFETDKKVIRCMGVGCPSTFNTEAKTLIIIGKVAQVNKLPRNVLRKLGPGEIAVEIPSNILPKTK